MKTGGYAVAARSGSRCGFQPRRLTLLLPKKKRLRSAWKLGIAARSKRNERNSKIAKIAFSYKRESPFVTLATAKIKRDIHRIGMSFT